MTPRPSTIALLAPALALTAGGWGCIQASRPSPSASDTGDTVGVEDTATTVDVDVVDTTSDSVTPDVPPSCDGAQCVIDGGCVDAGAGRPGWPCFACDPGRDPAGWSLREQGASCDDDDACTPSSACTDDGRCVGEPDPTCETLPECVTAADCSSGACSYTLEPDTCLIDAACYKTGDVRLGASCEACYPVADPFAWTARTSGSCDDGDPCTKDDLCDLEARCGGVEIACDDQVPCTDDYCVDGRCEHEAKDGACYIDGTCYAAGASSDVTYCRTCSPAVSGSDWSPATGPDCDDLDACTGPDSCADGSCSGPLVKVDSEPNDDPATFDLLATGNVDFDAAFPSGDVAGNLNPADTDQDYFGYGMLMNLNAVKRKPKVRLRGLVESAAYSLCIWARCGISDATARKPTVTCPVGGTVTLGGNFVGCCTTIQGANEFAGSLSVSCAEDQSSTDLGLVRVRVATGETNEAECPGYTLDWGAVDY